MERTIPGKDDGLAEYPVPAMIRRLLVIAAVAVAAIAVVRNGAVLALTSSRPAVAERLWSGHPTVQRAAAMAQVGEAARSGQPAGPAAISGLESVAVREPLAIEPLLVKAVIAQDAGDRARAERLYALAEERQGRALPPHYFLAELYLRSGRGVDGLRELANLARLSPGGIGSSAPFVAQYARDPGNWPRIRDIFRTQPELSNPVLVALAQDPANARAILALAGPAQRNSAAPWLPPLLGSMIAAGRYAEARSLWFTAGGTAATSAALVHDPDFADNRLPPPFNWELAQSPVGLAERGRGSGLHVIFYGSQGGLLARQLLVLAPGQYVISLRVAGQMADPQAMAWSVRCDKSPLPLATFPIRGPGAFSWAFSVPAGCPAQWLQLDGRAQDINGPSDLSIARIDLRTRGPNG
ncbi:MAG: hypothetical protein V4491_09090 [Pseudomonadota bacterium]